MNLLKYFIFYYRQTNGKMMIFLVATLISVGCQMLSAAAIVTVLGFGSANAMGNRVATIVYFILEQAHITTQSEQFVALLGFALVSFYLSSATMIFVVWYTAKLQTSLLIDMQRDMIKKILQVDYEFYMTKNIGSLSNIIIQQIRQVSQSFKFYTNILTSMLFSCAYLFLPMIMNPILVVMMGVMSIPLVLVIPIINRKTKDASMQSVREFGKLNGIIIQMLSHFKYLKSTVTYPAVVNKQEGFIHKLANLVRKLSLLGGINEFGLLAYAITVCIILVYWQFMVMKSPIIDSVVILGLLFYASRKMLTVPTSYQKFLGVSGAIIVCRELEAELLLHEETSQLDSGGKPNFSGRIEFNNVTFKYQSGKAPVLDKVSLEIMPNSSVAFVGDTGSGKSTVVNMITGLLQPVSGTVSLAGTDFQTLNMRELRRGISYVTQEPVIFNDTVINNISLWQPHINRTEIIKAAEKAQAAEFIEELPEKYDTLLGDNGVNVSGGQRQRITIAREILRNAPILILDEATSALDSKTERMIQSSIDKLRGERTIIIIAHRLSTIKKCDQIFVLDQGRIAEHGNYQQLYEQNGKFRHMVDTQNL